jgi:hypothetical protein
VKKDVAQYWRYDPALCKESNYAKKAIKYVIISEVLVDLLSIISTNDD